MKNRNLILNEPVDELAKNIHQLRTDSSDANIVAKSHDAESLFKEAQIEFLFCDDDKQNHLTVTRLISKLFKASKITGVYSAEAAEAELIAHPTKYQILILDDQMPRPGRHGNEASPIIKTKFPHLIIIHYSTTAKELYQGASFALAKPMNQKILFNSQELIKCVHTIVEEQKAQKSFAQQANVFASLFHNAGLFQQVKPHQGTASPKESTEVKHTF